MIHANFEEDTQGDLVGIEWYCSQYCYSEAGHKDTGAWAKKDNHTLLMCNTCEDAYLFRLRTSGSE